MTFEQIQLVGRWEAHRRRGGASCEGFALEQVLRLAKPDEAYSWATHQGAELNLLMLKGRQRVGVEFKRADAPAVTRSMQIAPQDLKLDALYLVYPGEHRFKLAPGIEAVPLWALLPPAQSLQRWMRRGRWRICAPQRIPRTIALQLPMFA